MHLDHIPASARPELEALLAKIEGTFLYYHFYNLILVAAEVAINTGVMDGCEGAYGDQPNLIEPVVYGDEDIRPGASVTVRWKPEARGYGKGERPAQRDLEDRGYLLTLPGPDADDPWMSGVVHFPEPQGSDDNDGGEWQSLDRLRANPMVATIKIRNR